jgi:hypothetical protein
MILTFQAHVSVLQHQVDWTTTMDFSENSTIYVDVSESGTGLVMLVSPPLTDGEVRWFAPSPKSSTNIFTAASSIQLGDSCPEDEDGGVVWLSEYNPRVTLWTVDTDNAIVYGCMNSTYVTQIGGVINLFLNATDTNATIP